eukprot:741935-Amphidinium_carterae.2
MSNVLKLRPVKSYPPIKQSPLNGEKPRSCAWSYLTVVFGLALCCKFELSYNMVRDICYQIARDIPEKSPHRAWLLYVQDNTPHTLSAPREVPFKHN